MTRRNIKLERKIARERIDILFKLAKENFFKNKTRANRYARLAWKIALRYNVRLPEKWKLSFCRGCKSFLMPGYNMRVRLNKGRVIITCLECGRVRRIPMTREKRERYEKSEKEASHIKTQRMDR